MGKMDKEGGGRGGEGVRGLPKFLVHFYSIWSHWFLFVEHFSLSERA